MKKRITITLLIGLLSINYLSGYMTVICHGNDGHISVESASHNHCDCPIKNNMNSDKDSEISNLLSIDHIHCTDTLRVSNLYAVKQGNVKSPISMISTTDVFYISNIVPTYSLNRYSISNIDNFFTPLQTIILIA